MRLFRLPDRVRFIKPSVRLIHESVVCCGNASTRNVKTVMGLPKGGTNDPDHDTNHANASTCSIDSAGQEPEEERTNHASQAGGWAVPGTPRAFRRRRTAGPSGGGLAAGLCQRVATWP